MRISILSILLLFAFNSSIFATINGDGSKESPFLIQSLTDFLEFRDTVNHGFYNANAILQTDIDLSSVCYIDSVKNEEIQWLPIGEGNGIHYKGYFDGNGHVVKNIYVNSDVECYRGVFGSTNNATILNLGSTDIYIKGGYYTGGIVGVADSTRIINCYTQGFISGYFTSGIVGCAYHTSIINCYSICTIQGNYYGCIAGYQDICDIRHCYYNPAFTNRDIGYGTGDVTQQNTSAFKDGTVTNLLNEYVTMYGGDSLLFWNQEIGIDDIPIFGSTSSVFLLQKEESYISCIGNELYFYAQDNGTASIYSIDGTEIARKRYTVGINHMGHYDPGCYIIMGKKILIK